jgi:putative ABC transport system permease protein
VTLAGNAPQPHYFRMLSALETPERPAKQGAPDATAMTSVAPDYFSVLGMPLLSGRTFDEGSVTRNEAIVSASLAKQLWPNESPLGRRVRNTAQRPPLEPWLTVVGVVPDVVADLLEGTVRPGLYRPLDVANTGGLGGGTVAMIVRMRGDNAAAMLKQFVTSIQPNRPDVVVENIRAMIDESVAGPRFFMRILIVFAAIGVLLAAIGLFGVISYSVAQRTREIGVRMAFGATRTSIARLVVGDGIRLAAIGVGLGLVGAVAATRLIQNLLYGVSRLDPFAFGVGGALLVFVAIVACIVPMLRATAVDPVVAVRVD